MLCVVPNPHHPPPTTVNRFSQTIKSNLLLACGRAVRFHAHRRILKKFMSKWNLKSTKIMVFTSVKYII